MNKIIMYSGEHCGPCQFAKGLLKEYIESGHVVIVTDIEAMKEVGVKSLPTFKQTVGDKVVEHIGFLADVNVLIEEGFKFPSEWEDDEELINEMADKEIAADEKRLYGPDVCVCS